MYGTVLSWPVILLCEGVYAEASSRGYICFVDRYGGLRIRELVDQFLSFHKSYSAAGESEAWVISGAGFMAVILREEGE